MLWESHKPLLWADLLCKNTIARFYPNNKLLIRILRILFRHDLNLLDPKPRSWLNKNTISDCFSHNRCVYRLIFHVIYYLWCCWDTSVICVRKRESRDLVNHLFLNDTGFKPSKKKKKVSKIPNTVLYIIRVNYIEICDLTRGGKSTYFL